MLRLFVKRDRVAPRGIHRFLSRSIGTGGGFERALVATLSGGVELPGGLLPLAPGVVEFLMHGGVSGLGGHALHRVAIEQYGRFREQQEDENHRADEEDEKLHRP